VKSSRRKRRGFAAKAGEPHERTKRRRADGPVAETGPSCVSAHASRTGRAADGTAQAGERVAGGAEARQPKRLQPRSAANRRSDIPVRRLRDRPRRVGFSHATVKMAHWSRLVMLAEARRCQTRRLTSSGPMVRKWLLTREMQPHRMLAECSSAGQPPFSLLGCLRDAMAEAIVHKKVTALPSTLR